MKVNKKIAILLSGILIASQLSGCSTKDSENTSKNEEVTTNAIIEDNEKENSENKEENTVDLLNEVTPKLKTLEGIEEVKEEVNNQFKEILTKNNFNINYSTPNKSFTLSESPYNKYTKDYEQSIFSLIAENYTEGTVLMNIRAVKEFHKDDGLDKSDDFLKCMYDLYIYTSKENISFEDFDTKIQEAINNDLISAELDNYSSRDYIYINVDDEGDSTKIIEFNFYAEIKDTLKRKYYKKQYETVSAYKDDTDVIQNKVNKIEEAYYSESEDYEDNLHSIYDTAIESSESKFMQTGSISITGGKVSGGTAVPKFEEKEVNDLINVFKIVFGDTLYSKANTGNLTTEKLNELIESQIIINTFSRKYNLPDMDMYIDNVSFEFGEVGDFLEKDEDDWDYYSDDRYAELYFEFNIPVIAEGISEM